MAIITPFIWPRKGFVRGWLYLVMRILRLRSSDYSLAAGLAAGVAVSFTPFIGFHIFFAIGLAWRIRGNIITAMIGTIIGNPLTFPFIWVLIYSIGSLVLGVDAVDVDVSALSYQMLFDKPGMVFISMLIGGVIVGGFMGVLTFAIGYIFATPIKRWLKQIRDVRLQKFKRRKHQDD
ncbi:MAG: DUF2062 domain-containing protein [Candidatus Puniceispirillales bacterium WSBS_2018_MAG_OTU23]